MRQAWMNGVWVARAWCRYPVSFCLRHAAPMALVGSLVLLLALSMLSTWFLLAAAALFLGYLTSTIVAAVQIAFRNGFGFLLLVPPIMMCYHFTYGFATLVGLASWNKANKVVSQPLHESS
jgi:ABC-type uncharacterized transport system permease subunit